MRLSGVMRGCNCEIQVKSMEGCSPARGVMRVSEACCRHLHLAPVGLRAS